MWDWHMGMHHSTIILQEKYEEGYVYCARTGACHSTRNEMLFFFQDFSRILYSLRTYHSPFTVPDRCLDVYLCVLHILSPSPALLPTALYIPDGSSG